MGKFFLEGFFDFLGAEAGVFELGVLTDRTGFGRIFFRAAKMTDEFFLISVKSHFLVTVRAGYGEAAVSAN